MSGLRARSAIEETLAMQLELNRLPTVVREHRFDPARRWRFDFAWPDAKVAIECEGGTWTNGRHNRGSGYQKDLEKYNAAALLGWIVLRFTGMQVRHGLALTGAQAALRRRGFLA